MTRFHGRLRRVGGVAADVVLTGAVATSVAFCIAGVAVSIAKEGFAGDAAAWAQAAGSILAIAGAAWVIRSEARQARRARREEGEEAAWAVRFVVIQAQFDSQIVAAELTGDDGAITKDRLRSWRQRAENSALALATVLTRADHIHAAVILTACNAKVLVDHLQADLRTLEAVVAEQVRPGQDLIDDIVAAHLNLQALVEQYDARVRGIRMALNRGGDILPLDERPEWSVPPRP